MSLSLLHTFLSLSLFCFFPLYPQEETREIEVQIFAKNQSAQKKILIGEEIQVEMLLSDRIPFHLFKNVFEGKFLFEGSSYIGEIKSFSGGGDEPSSRFLAKLSFIGPIVPKMRMLYPLKELGLTLKFINMDIEVFDDPEVSKGQKPGVLSQGFQKKRSYWWLYGVFIFFAIGLSLALYRYFKIKEGKKKRKEAISLWLEKFKKFKSRGEIEKLYSYRSQWKYLLNPEKKALWLFKEAMVKHQYKKDWSLEDWDEVNGALAGLIKSFEKGER